MKKTDITPEMFEAWKAEMRELFKDDPKSMNLIALGLRVLDDPKDNELHEGWNKKLLEFYENSLVYQRKLMCEHCGKPMDVYYTVVCNHCEAGKPKVEHSECNYIRAVNWVKNNEPDFDSDYVWNYLVDNEVIKGNDTYVKLFDDCQTDVEEYNKNIRLFKKHFPIENIKWFVSW